MTNKLEVNQNMAHHKRYISWILLISALMGQSLHARGARLPGIFGHAQYGDVAAINDYQGPVDLLDEWGRTPLYYALSCRQKDAVKMLLRKGANLSFNVGNSRNVAHLIAQDGVVDAIPLMLEIGINLNAQDLDGMTPLHVAAAMGKTEFALAMLQVGIRHDLRNQVGLLAIDIASPIHKPGYFSFSGCILNSFSYNSTADALQKYMQELPRWLSLQPN